MSTNETSAAQIEANRVNSRLSTGPRSEQGKHASSANATREGLTGARILVRPGQEPLYEALRDNLKNELAPEGEFQTQHFEVILHAAWNIRRCIVLEGELQCQAAEQGALDAMLDDDLALKLDRLYRYKKMHENSQRKAVAELRRLQAEQIYRGYEHPDVVDSKILLDSAKVDAQVAAAQQQRKSPTCQKAQNEAISQQISALIDPPAQWGDEVTRRYFENRKSKAAA